MLHVNSIRFDFGSRLLKVPESMRHLKRPQNIYSSGAKKIFHRVEVSIDKAMNRLDGFKPVTVEDKNPNSHSYGKKMTNWVRKFVTNEYDLRVQTLRWNGSETTTMYRGTAEKKENLIGKVFLSPNGKNTITSEYQKGKLISKKALLQGDFDKSKSTGEVKTVITLGYDKNGKMESKRVMEICDNSFCETVYKKTFIY